MPMSCLGTVPRLYTRQRLRLPGVRKLLIVCMYIMLVIAAAGLQDQAAGGGRVCVCLPVTSALFMQDTAADRRIWCPQDSHCWGRDSGGSPLVSPQLEDRSDSNGPFSNDKLIASERLAHTEQHTPRCGCRNPLPASGPSCAEQLTCQPPLISSIIADDRNKVGSYLQS